MSADMVQLREPMVDDIIGVMDGVSFPVQCTDERLAQNAMYCGYDCDTMVNNVFAYGPDGKVFFAAVNFPGSWADGSLTAHFLPYMKRKIGEYKICVDQGFPRSGDACGTFVGPGKTSSSHVFIATFVTTCLKLAIFTHHFAKQASGGCVGFRERSLTAKVVCQATRPNVALLSRQSFLFTIS